MNNFTILEESDHKDRFSLNKIQLNNVFGTVVIYWTDDQLKIEQLKEQLIDSGTNKDNLNKLCSLIGDFTYQMGLDAAMDFNS